MPYADRTRVPIFQSRGEIERLLVKHKASHFASMIGPDHVAIAFRAYDRHVRFILPMPKKTTSSDQLQRTRWRGLLLCIKAKFEAIEAGIETFDQAFMPHVVMPSGETAGEVILPRIADAYAKGLDVPLLPDHRGNR